MRVVSQNRNLSFNFDQFEIWTQMNAIYRRVGNDSEVIGSYATQERAKEVFEDIHKAYAPVYSISNGLTEEQIRKILMTSKYIAANHIINTGEDMYLSTFDNYVYYMPEE